VSIATENPQGNPLNLIRIMPAKGNEFSDFVYSRKSFSRCNETAFSFFLQPFPETLGSILQNCSSLDDAVLTETLKTVKKE
jgi:hypothetical protein